MFGCPGWDPVIVPNLQLLPGQLDYRGWEVHTLHVSVVLGKGICHIQISTVVCFTTAPQWFVQGYRCDGPCGLWRTLGVCLCYEEIWKQGLLWGKPTMSSVVVLKFRKDDLKSECIYECGCPMQCCACLDLHVRFTVVPWLLPGTDNTQWNWALCEVNVAPGEGIEDSTTQSSTTRGPKGMM